MNTSRVLLISGTIAMTVSCWSQGLQGEAVISKLDQATPIPEQLTKTYLPEGSAAWHAQEAQIKRDDASRKQFNSNLLQQQNSGNAISAQQRNGAGPAGEIWVKNSYDEATQVTLMDPKGNAWEFEFSNARPYSPLKLSGKPVKITDGGRGWQIRADARPWRALNTVSARNNAQKTYTTTRDIYEGVKKESHAPWVNNMPEASDEGVKPRTNPIKHFERHGFEGLNPGTW